MILSRRLSTWHIPVFSEKDEETYPEPSDPTDIKAEGRDSVVLIEYDEMAVCSYEVIRAFVDYHCYAIFIYAGKLTGCT